MNIDVTLQIIICILIADFLSGFFHWLEDTYCLKDIPFLGKLVCEHNIKHHEDPKLMTLMPNIIKNNYQSLTLAIILFIILYFLNLLSWHVILIGILSGFGNQIHLWNHQTKSGYFVEFLKDSGLIQSQKQHNKHHIPPYNKSYCVLLNFNNAWLDRINFWRKLEYVLTLFGLKVKRGSLERGKY